MNTEENKTRLESIILEVNTRQVTMYPGYKPRADELLVAEVERLREANAEQGEQVRELVDAVLAAYSGEASDGRGCFTADICFDQLDRAKALAVELKEQPND
jgi:hypothetical protein